MLRFRILAFTAVTLLPTMVLADPCGMVPPIYQGPGVPITRVGEQKTYVFFKNDLESIVIRPGFEGQVEEFGMLIPFPTPPAIRKVSDDIFGHLAAAIDPPEVVIHLHDYAFGGFGGAEGAPGAAMAEESLGIMDDEVRVIREEAVGMYEVAVLEAGSAAALKKWMTEHSYRFPDGMERVCNDYVADRWCFVAVKTKVGEKKAADPRPGQRIAVPSLPTGATFDGHVQAMGFRFRTDQLVVPMRLSAFNEGELRNIVYLLTDGPHRIRNIPEEFVMRQLTGQQLFKNVTGPLPLRIVGGTEKDIDESTRQRLPQLRDPKPKNGAARRLFAADLQAVAEGNLSLTFEETEKEMLRVGEALGLRGGEIDRLNQEQIDLQRQASEAAALADLYRMTITVVDGDFPREVLAGENSTFAKYRMPRSKNNVWNYDATKMSPRKKGRDQGKLILKSISGRATRPAPTRRMPFGSWFSAALLTIAAFGSGYRQWWA